jgi:hypothetical protein
MKNALVFCLLVSACSAPTLQQRQENWRRHRDLTRVGCVLGRADPAMPPDVRDWCMVVIGP